MSSYADIAAENAPPQSEQPKPDPGYLEGHNASHTDVNPNALDVDSGKVNVVPSDTDLEHLKTQSQEAYEEAVAKAREQRKQLENDAKATANSAKKAASNAADEASKSASDAKKAGKQLADDAQNKGKQLADDADKIGKELKAEADKLGKDARVQADKAANKAAQYLEKGNKELNKDAEILRNKGEQGAKNLKKKAGEAEKELESFWNSFSSDPKQWGPALAAVNVALLGGLGVYAYTHKEQVQRTDRRLISAVAVGVLGLIGGQSYWATETAKKQNGGSL